MVAVNSHGAVPLVVPGLAGVGTVDRDLVVVGSQTVAVCVRVREQTTLYRVCVCVCVCVCVNTHVLPCACLSGHMLFLTDTVSQVFDEQPFIIHLTHANV